MKILVTGAAGFIGGHLTDKLLEKGYDLIGLDLKFDRNLAATDSEIIVCDLLEYESLDSVIARSDVIVHLAALSRVEDGQREPQRCFRVNVGSTIRILESLKKYPNKVLIFGSSREVYGQPEILPVTEFHPKNPVSVYGISKFASEELIGLYSRLHGTAYVILRFSNVYGSARDLPERVIPKFARLAREGSPITVNGGDQILDFTFIDDIVNGIANLVDKVTKRDGSCINQDYHLTSGEGTSVLTLAKTIKDIFGSSSELEIHPARDYDVMKFIGDHSKALTAFSYRPEHSLRNGLSEYKKRLET